jgi:hypothetical protein
VENLLETCFNNWWFRQLAFSLVVLLVVSLEVSTTGAPIGW